MSNRQELFRRIFPVEAFRDFRAGYEAINPDRPLETGGISFGETDPLLRSLLTDAQGVNSFVDEFLPQHGTFLHGPFPLPGNRVTRSAWDCRGKAGAYQACGIDPGSVQGKRVLLLRRDRLGSYLRPGQSAAESRRGRIYVARCGGQDHRDPAAPSADGSGGTP